MCFVFCGPRFCYWGLLGLFG